MEGNTRSALSLLRCEPGLRRAWQLQVVPRLVTQPQDGTRPPPGEVGARGAGAPRTATGAENEIVSSKTGWWLPRPSVMAAGKTTSPAPVVPSSMRIVRTVYAEGQPQKELQRKEAPQVTASVGWLRGGPGSWEALRPRSTSGHGRLGWSGVAALLSSAAPL